MSFYKINYKELEQKKEFLTNSNTKIYFSVRKDNKNDLKYLFTFRMEHDDNYNMNNSLVDIYNILSQKNITDVSIYLVNESHESLLYHFDNIDTINIEFEQLEDNSRVIVDNNFIFETRVTIL